MTTVEFQYVIGMLGTVAFAATAVIAVLHQKTDLFGAAVLGLITAIGGGTVRDLILDVPVFWATDLNYVWVSLVASLVTFYCHRFVSQRNIYALMLYLDGLGAALFAIQAANKVQSQAFALPAGPVLLGIVTAIGGGVIRDVLANRTSLIMTRELYAVPITIGCVLYVTLISYFPEQSLSIGAGCVFFIFILRAMAIHWNLCVPSWMLMQTKGE